MKPPASCVSRLINVNTNSCPWAHGTVHAHGWDWGKQSRTSAGAYQWQSYSCLWMYAKRCITALVSLICQICVLIKEIIRTKTEREVWLSFLMKYCTDFHIFLLQFVLQYAVSCVNPSLLEKTQMHHLKSPYPTHASCICSQDPKWQVLKNKSHPKYIIYRRKCNS